MPKETEQKAAVPRLDGVDTLRGLSIIAVILLHIYIRFISEDVSLSQSWPYMWKHLLWFNGGNGVTVFFAVSGFLITLTSLRRFGELGSLRPWVFYRIRFARIMPLLLLFLLILTVLDRAHVSDFVVKESHFTLTRALISALLFHLNWLEASRDAWLPACWTVLWSLSIEEMFYLFFPLVSRALFSKPLNQRFALGKTVWIALALAFAVMGPFVRTVWSPTELKQQNSYIGGMSTIALGCLTAFLVDAMTRSRKWKGSELQRRLALALQACGWMVILVIALWPRWHWIRPTLRTLGISGTDDTVLALATCVVLGCVYLRGIQGRLISAPIRWYGRHSYELYLFHEFVIIAGVDLYLKCFPKGSSRGTIILFVITIVAMTAPLAWALSKYFSEPLNRKLRGAPLPSQLFVQ